MSLIKEITDLRSRIGDLKKQLTLLEKQCKHPVEAVCSVKSSHFPYKDPLQVLREWETHICAICGKQWETARATNV